MLAKDEVALPEDVIMHPAKEPHFLSSWFRLAGMHPNPGHSGSQIERLKAGNFVNRTQRLNLGQSRRSFRVAKCRLLTKPAICAIT